MSTTPRAAGNDPTAAIRGLEERAFNAWPALETVLADGWVLRFANGYTKRANSVNALTPAVPVEVAIPTFAPVYARRGLPLIFRLSPLAGPNADPGLAAKGFRRADDTIVMTAPIDASIDLDADMLIEGQPSPAWLDGFSDANRVPQAHQATHDRMLSAIRFPVAFASLHSDGKPIAWGIAVAERGMVGLFDIVTLPGARRQGAGRRLVQSLLAWGCSQSATQTYLQVVASNAPAIALYRQLGFSEAYRYHYRIAPF